MKTKLNVWFTAIALVLVLQSCLKNNDVVLNYKDSKLLLSTVKGSIKSEDSRFFASAIDLYYIYSWSNDVFEAGPNTGQYQKDFLYGDQKGNFPNVNLIQRETFSNGGHYDFLYHTIFPDKVLDYSAPGSDLGYWKFYINNAQIQKVGIVYKAGDDPDHFEFYNRNQKGQLASYIFGKTLETPVYKVVYQYDNSDNISQFQIFIPATTSVASMQDIMMKTQQKNGNATLRKLSNVFNKKVENLQRISSDKQQQYAKSSAISNESVEYRLYLTATIITDHGINPFSQQEHILFYQTNRFYTAYDLTPFFLSLLRSNPVKVEYSIPDWGPYLAVQTFSYTYNSKGYPLSVHEEVSDPNWVLNGNYTKDSQIEYIKN